MRSREGSKGIACGNDDPIPVNDAPQSLALGRRCSAIARHSLPADFLPLAPDNPDKSTRPYKNFCAVRKS